MFSTPNSFRILRGAKWLKIGTLIARVSFPVPFACRQRFTQPFTNNFALESTSTWARVKGSTTFDMNFWTPCRWGPLSLVFSKKQILRTWFFTPGIPCSSGPLWWHLTKWCYCIGQVDAIATWWAITSNFRKIYFIVVLVHSAGGILVVSYAWLPKTSHAMAISSIQVKSPNCP